MSCKEVEETDTAPSGPGMFDSYGSWSAWLCAWDHAFCPIDDLKHNAETKRVANLDSEEVLQLIGQHASTLQLASGPGALRDGPSHWECGSEDDVQRQRFHIVNLYSRSLIGVLESIKRHKADLARGSPTDVSDRDTFETGLSNRLASLEEKLSQAKTWDAELGGHDAAFAVFYESLCTANAVRSLALLKKSVPETIQGNCSHLHQKEQDGFLRPDTQVLKDIEARRTEISNELDVPVDEQGAWQEWVKTVQNHLGGSMNDAEREKRLDGVRGEAVLTHPDRLIGDYTLAEVESLLRQTSEDPHDTISPCREDPRFNCFRRHTEPDVGSSAGSQGQ